MDVEGPGLIRHWAGDRGLEMHTLHLDGGDPLPELAREDALVIMGGPMGVNDRCSIRWLDAEIEWLAAHLRNGGRAFGVCLGAQLIAAAMGARVRRNAFKEIGWWRVDFEPAAVAEGIFAGLPQSLTVLQWHGDTFDIPAGAQKAAGSEACANQAFSVGSRVVALQFHLEAEPGLLAEFVTDFDPELKAGGRYVSDGPSILAGAATHVPMCKGILYTLLDRWLADGSVTSQAASSASVVA